MKFNGLSFFALWTLVFFVRIKNINLPFLIVIYFLCVYCICLPIELLKEEIDYPVILDN